jgi:hypothetical protein
MNKKSETPRMKQEFQQTNSIFKILHDTLNSVQKQACTNTRTYLERLPHCTTKMATGVISPLPEPVTTNKTMKYTQHFRLRYFRDF